VIRTAGLIKASKHGIADMVEQYKFFFITTAVLCIIALGGYWGSWVSSTLMSVDKDNAVILDKIDDQHNMLVAIMEHLSANQKASWDPSIKATLNK
jgi:hypothetical protein